VDDLRNFASPARALGRVVELRTVTASTNDDARALAAKGAPHGAVVIADAQTAGRGRRGRAWSSPPGENLYASFVLRPKVRIADAPGLALVAGLSIAEAVEAFAGGASVRVKWPNDVRAGGLKLAGVLVEGSLRGAELAWVVLGVGINVRGVAAPEGLDAIATTLRALRRGEDLARADVLAAVCARLEARLDAYERDGFASLHGALSARCETLGARVTTELASGVAESLADDGALLVRTDAGELVTVRVGDVS
jgi:BirA family biotin operon repressor/biotin-[acetyl-CoA-carboxylase] ligase